MDRKDKKKRHGKIANLLQLLNPRHVNYPATEHQTIASGGHGTIYGDQSPTGNLPPPCPGPSIVQTSGVLGLDDRTMNEITSNVVMAVKQELQPLVESIQQLLSQLPNTTHHCPSCTLSSADINYACPIDDKEPVYVNNANLPEPINPEVDIVEPSGVADRPVINSVPNPSYSRQPEILPIIIGIPKKSPDALPNSPRPYTMLRKLSGRRRHNKRDCYAKALQTHIEDIVDGTIFKESELPDVLTSGGCLTEDECRTIREKPDRKDQVRRLVTVIKTRDLDVLIKFVDFIEKHNKTLAQKIRQTIESNIDLGFRVRKCLLCKLKSQVNVKYVADKLWAEDCITDELYNELIFSEKPTGVQDKLWERILNSFVSRDAFKTLGNSLRNKGHYKHLADGIHRTLSNAREPFECMCKMHVSVSTILSSSTSDSNVPASMDSLEMRSSCEILSVELSNKTSEDTRSDSHRWREGGHTMRYLNVHEVNAESTNVKNSVDVGKLKIEASSGDGPPPLPNQSTKSAAGLGDAGRLEKKRK